MSEFNMMQLIPIFLFSIYQVCFYLKKYGFAFLGKTGAHLSLSMPTAKQYTSPYHDHNAITTLTTHAHPSSPELPNESRELLIKRLTLEPIP